jgi:excisionase family DNA binding protein
MASPPDVMTLEEAALYLRVSPRAVRRARYERGLPAVPKFKHLRFLKTDIDKWLSQIGSNRDNRNRRSKEDRRA